MKYILVVLALTSSMFAQHGFQPVEPSPEPVDFSQVGDASAWVRGHWVATDEQSALTGPAVSEISCVHTTSTCVDTNANASVVGAGTFNLSGGYDEYTVQRWTPTEIVASNVGGGCHARHVIKFDRVHKKVFWMQTLSEPIADMPKQTQDFCKVIGMNLELKNGMTFSVSTGNSK